MASHPTDPPPLSLATILKSKRFVEAAETLNPVLLWAALARLIIRVVRGSFRWLVTYIR